MKQRRRRLKGATDLHLSLYTEAALPIHPPSLTVGRNGRRTAGRGVEGSGAPLELAHAARMSTCGMRLFERGGWIAAARQSQDESSVFVDLCLPCYVIIVSRSTSRLPCIHALRQCHGGGMGVHSGRNRRHAALISPMRGSEKKQRKPLLAVNSGLLLL